MIPHLRCALAAAVMALLVASASAQSSPTKMTLHFDPAATKINWTLKDILHTVRGTLQLKSGLMIFDDYLWSMEGPGRQDPLNMPKPAIDAFINIFQRKMFVVRGAPLYQLFATKVGA